jgi:hypothetical protein
VFGHRVNAGEDQQKMTRLYSPRGSSLLAIQAVRPSSPSCDTKVEDSGKPLAEEVARGEEVAGDCLFVAKRLAEPWTDYVQASWGVQR